MRAPPAQADNRSASVLATNAVDILFKMFPLWIMNFVKTSAMSYAPGLKARPDPIPMAGISTGARSREDCAMLKI